jgi:hypothetical protein
VRQSTTDSRIAVHVLADRNAHRNPLRNMVCREAVTAINLLHAVIKMMEDANEQLPHRSRLAGEGFKPLKGAVVKSHGIERLGESMPCIAGINRRDERK